jgi:hypothetical protein
VAVLLKADGRRFHNPKDQHGPISAVSPVEFELQAELSGN